MASGLIKRAREMGKRESDTELLNQFKQDNVLNSLKLIELGANPQQNHEGLSILEHLVRFQTKDPALRKSVTDFFIRMRRNKSIEAGEIKRIKRSLEIEGTLEKLRKKTE